MVSAPTKVEIQFPHEVDSVCKLCFHSLFSRQQKTKSTEKLDLFQIIV